MSKYIKVMMVVAMSSSLVGCGVMSNSAGLVGAAALGYFYAKNKK